ncbi:acyl-CoA dehydrogenase family protein [Pseudonocardia hispaniensis]|uniref:Acyl-CoA dehydrogenase family protein n=1 Tax=Pseudonocardia hispaniensis TaxID=904933 RepID=A0ABW1J1M6_9PSEU
MTLVEELLREFPPATTGRTAFLKEQFDRGLAWVHFPVGRGGLDLPRNLQVTVHELLSAAGAPTMDHYLGNALGVAMIAPALVAHGRPDQWDAYLRPMFCGEEIWCQLFSEPGAGSDLAALRTRAVLDGDAWVINGQKIWTTAAHRADRGLLMARTGEPGGRHRGLAAFVIDMRDPHVDVRPLRQIDGSAHLNEVYFDDLRVPAGDLVGAPDQGWQVAITIMMNERVSIGGGSAGEGSQALAEVVEVWCRREDRDPVMRDRLVQLAIKTRAADLLNQEAARNLAVDNPGPEGSLAKLIYSQLKQSVYEFGMDALGSTALLFGSYAFHRPEDHVPDEFEIQRHYLFARGDSIGGGTSEVMRNIVGERVLGLPKEPRP